MTGADSVPERVIEQVRKLFALSGSENEHEAAAAAAKAAELLLKYDLALADIADRGWRPPQADLDYFEHPLDRELTRWRARLCAAFAEHGFCRVIVTRRPVRDARTGRKRLERSLGLVGRPHDAEVVWFLYETVSRRIAELASDYDAYGARIVPSFLGPRQSFILGALSSVEERLKAERAKATTADAPSAGKALALIVRTDRELDAYLARRFPRLGTYGGRTRPLTVDPAAYAAGRREGANLAFTRGVAGAETPALAPAKGRGGKAQ